jgi:hypothetical protein
MGAVGAVTSVVTLRLLPARNGQEQGIRYAAAYQIGPGEPQGLERKTGFEPATPILARLCATTAPLPLDEH